MRQYEPALETYWVTQSSYFRLVTTVVLGMGITDENILFCHGISEQSRENKISMREYNDRTVYNCFENTFLFNCGIPDFNFPPMPIDDSPHPNKRVCYIPGPLPATISVAYGNSVSTLTDPSDSPQDIFLIYYAPNIDYIMRSRALSMRGNLGPCPRPWRGVCPDPPYTATCPI